MPGGTADHDTFVKAFHLDVSTTVKKLATGRTYSSTDAIVATCNDQLSNWSVTEIRFAQPGA